MVLHDFCNYSVENALDGTETINGKPSQEDAAIIWVRQDGGHIKEKKSRMRETWKQLVLEGSISTGYNSSPFMLRAVRRLNLCSYSTIHHRGQLCMSPGHTQSEASSKTRQALVTVNGKCLNKFRQEILEVNYSLKLSVISLIYHFKHWDCK